MNLLRRTVIVAATVYCTLVMVMMILETRLVYPAKSPAGEDWTAANLDHRELTAVSGDGTRIHGWVLDGPEGGPGIVFFHGNAEDVAEVAPRIGNELRRRLGATVYIFDYRGYGLTKGIPDEENLIEDGIAAVTTFASDMGLSPEELIFYGRSLGGGVAIGVASKTGARALMLDRTFNRLTDAASSNYPWLPVRLLMRNRFDSMKRISALDVPVLQSHFRNDRLIPVQLARQLFECINSENRKFIEFPTGGHTAPIPEPWWPEAVAFMAGLDSAPVQTTR